MTETVTRRTLFFRRYMNVGLNMVSFRVVRFSDDSESIKALFRENKAVFKEHKRRLREEAKKSRKQKP